MAEAVAVVKDELHQRLTTIGCRVEIKILSSRNVLFPLIEVELSPQHAPKTVNNFVFLAREGFYDGVSFHRVISDFMTIAPVST